jgi:hypothetical protein
MKLTTTLIAIIVLATEVFSDPFWHVYGDKGAEISTYKTIQPRYGELRKAFTVLVFVPEVIHKSTRIKVEDFGKSMPDDRIQTVKLNRVLRFTTGIYDYAVMTSTFAALGPALGRPAFYPLKISISVTEWCGNFFEDLLTDGKGAHRSMHSYFEAEGDKLDYIPAAENDLYEDDIPVLIREFEGEFMHNGDKKEFNIMPALWQSRITHEPLAYQKGWIKKEEALRTENGTSILTYKWTWEVGARTEEYWVEKSYPHHILIWKGSDGEQGELMRTDILPYWVLHANKDLDLRKEFGLPEVP